MNTSKSQKIEPFQIRQGMLALELGSTDSKTLEYLDFLTNQVPTGAIYFLHVLPRFDVLNSMLGRQGEGMVSNYEINDEVVAKMEEEIRTRMSTHEGMHVQFDVKEGAPLEQLLEDAKDVQSDLVIIGQKSGVSRHGILAKNLARRAPGNTLIVPDQSKVQLRRILVPIDFSQHSINAMRTALSLNESLEQPAEIVAVNIYEMPNLSVYKIQRTRAQFEKMLRKDHEEAFEAFLNTHFPDHKDQIRIELIMQEAPGIAQYVMDFADEQEADMIIMGAKGHSKVELLLLGSVTEKLLAINEHIPTLVVK